jgi:hypothetical protein
MRSGSRLQPERKHRAVALALRLHIRKTAAAHGLSAGHISRGNLYIKAVPAPVRLVVVKRLVGIDRYARAFLRIARPNRGDLGLFSWIGIFLRRWHDSALSGNCGREQKDNAESHD